jgi:Cu/Ag efflux pump CusA
VAAEIEVKKNARKAARKVKEAAEAVAQSDPVVAAEIEVKKNTRKAGRKAKEVAAEVKEAVEDKVVEEEVEVKKNARKAERKAKESVKKVADIPNIIIQSPMGGHITPEDIAKKVPKNTEDVYVRVDENKLYYVLKNGESGDVDIWE